MNIVIFGATSAIAKEVSRVYADQKCRLFLVARNFDKLRMLKADLMARGALEVEIFELNFLEFDYYQDIINLIISKISRLDILLLAQGELQKQIHVENNVNLLQNNLVANYASHVSILVSFTPFFENQNSGSIAVITSVAGDRPRQSIYLYASFKSALQVFLKGLRARLYNKNISVLDIRPGLVDTPMTAHMEKNLLFVKPREIALIIIDSIQNKKDVVYAPKFWFLIMFVIKRLPARIFYQLKL
ncbi:MAG: SDR family NAD(P)-dependent oxidoreductase [Halobacteriovoraceae bacterium]|jgi:decaprenylphospho-beta-D-erythro-pentofuranosid-2-ulose 2-reductase|nr:SDR family NAD(P)-dependent oxidoreductase [Halobacteriovoraceae bacterium]